MGLEASDHSMGKTRRAASASEMWGASSAASVRSQKAERKSRAVSAGAGGGSERGRPWMRIVLLAAAAYNLLWGGLVVALPETTLGWLGVGDARYPQFWQCVGMIVGVYGVGYLAAAAAPLRHWPIVLVGLLGKIFGPIGFLDAVLREQLPTRMAWTLLTNDLIWWVPFTLILIAAFRRAASDRSVARPGAEPVGVVSSTAEPSVPERAAP